MKPVTLCFSLLAIFVTGALAAEPDPISTDRPSYSSSPLVVGKGIWQIEAGLQLARDNDEVSSTEYTLPSALLRLGVSRAVELRLEGVSYLWQEKDEVHSDGLKDARLGIKWQLNERDSVAPVALHAGISLPIGDDEFSVDDSNPSVAMFWSYAGTIPWFGTVNLNYANEKYAVENAVGINFTLPGDASGFVEYLGVFPEHSGPRHDLNLGLTWLLSNDFQLDMHTTAGLNERATDFIVGVGLAYRFR